MKKIFTLLAMMFIFSLPLSAQRNDGGNHDHSDNNRNTDNRQGNNNNSGWNNMGTNYGYTGGNQGGRGDDHDNNNRGYDNRGYNNQRDNDHRDYEWRDNDHRDYDRGRYDNRNYRGVYNNYGHSYNYVMSEGAFQGLVFNIANLDFDNEKLSTAEYAVSENRMTSDQIRRLMLTLDFESSRLALAEYAYSYVIDRQNFYVVNQSLEFYSSRRELLAYMGR